LSGCGCSDIEIKDQSQRKVLYWLLGINLVMFFVEMGYGWFAQSTALIADSLDMLADATVYGIGLYVVGRAVRAKANAALISGYCEMALGLLILVDITRRIFVGSEPVSMVIMTVGAAALIANIVCLRLIYAHKDGDVHMRASWIFSANDVIANAGVILSGALVLWLDSRWPDIVIGIVIVFVILRGAKTIVADAKNELGSEAALEKPMNCKDINLIDK
jgi:Co/Zn/Cd efflux system component